MARTPLISGNWKMNLNHFEAIQIVQKLHYLVPKDTFEHVDVSVHPPFTDIRSVQTLIESEDLDFSLGAQHCHFEDTGAFTGEVSPAFLAKLNTEYVICGHSERREVFGETDEIVNAKAIAVLKENMTPIVCCGETLDERQAGQAESKVASQIAGSLAKLTAEVVGELVIAYEPIWAIGTGVTATAEQAQDTHKYCRSVIEDLYGAAAAAAVRIQYGGSVKGANSAELLGQPDIDGALVGGAALEAASFLELIRNAVA
jgi:triosephosphate isomerase